MNLGNLFKFIVDWTNVTSDGQQNLLVEILDIIGNNCNGRDYTKNYKNYE